MASTVADILNLIQYRVPAQGDYYHLINQAIRLIAKRLYLFNSGILKADLEVDFYAEATYTASTIAFVSSSTPDTITDSANGFVTAGFVAGMYITTGSTTNPGPFKLVTVAAGTLTLATTDVVVAAVAAATTITSVDDYQDMPSDFWGLSTGPEDDLYISGQQWILHPLPSRAAGLLYTGAGQPTYYEIRGTKMYLYSATSSDITVKGIYFAKPTAVTATTSEIPFNEEFDDVIADYTVAAFKEQPLATLQGMVYDAVDVISMKRDKSAAIEPVQTIEWDRITRGW